VDEGVSISHKLLVAAQFTAPAPEQITIVALRHGWHLWHRILVINATHIGSRWCGCRWRRGRWRHTAALRLQGWALGTLFVARTGCRALERTIVTCWPFVTGWGITTIRVHAAALGLQRRALETLCGRGYLLLAHRIVTACWRIGAHKALLAHWIIAPYWCIGTHKAFVAGWRIGAALTTLGRPGRKRGITPVIGTRRPIGTR